MPEFRVVWEIDIDADTPEEAAKEALDLQRDKESLCTYFTVISTTGEKIPVDLYELGLDKNKQ